MKLTLQILFPVILLFIGFFIRTKLIESAPPVKKKEISELVITTEVAQVTPANHPTEISAYGTLTTRDEANIVPQVSARILWLSNDFRVGNQIKKGDIIARLDKYDLEVLVANQQASIAQLESQLAEEQVLSQQSKDEWIASGRDIKSASEYRLRKPQIKSLNAQLNSAKASLLKAERDIERTIIKAPFNGIVSRRSTNIGEWATPQSSLGNLFNSERAELNITLTQQQYATVKSKLKFGLDKDSTLITISPENNPNITREAQLVRFNPIVDSKNQSLSLIAELQEPFSSEKGRIDIGAFVNVIIQGAEVKNAYAITESSIINDNYLWKVENDQLIKQTIKRLYSKNGIAYFHLTEAQKTIESNSLIHIVKRPLVSFSEGQKVKTQSPNGSSNPDEKGH